MIICRTPVRISFFGGGTDYPVWYDTHEGAVISTTIDKYCYISGRRLPPFFQYKYRIRCFKNEETCEIDDIQHPSARECLRFIEDSDQQDSYEIVQYADLPSQSGLGSSSAFTVCLLHTLHALKNQIPSKRDLAKQAIHVEQNMIGEAVGAQDQTAAAFGGLNKISFGGPHKIMVEPVIMSPERYFALEDRLMIFFTGFSRNASTVAEKQIQRIQSENIDLTPMITLVNEAFAILTNADSNLDDFGYLLDQQWRIKRDLCKNISNEKIDQIYQQGVKAGALGGKLLGAGGGGFILFYVPKGNQQNVKEHLSEYLHVPFRFDGLGSQIVYYAHSFR